MHDSQQEDYSTQEEEESPLFTEKGLARKEVHWTSRHLLPLSLHFVLAFIWMIIVLHFPFHSQPTNPLWPREFRKFNCEDFYPFLIIHF